MQPILERIQKFLQGRSPVFTLLVGFLLVLLFGVLDYATGADYVLDLFYLLPLFFVTWYAGTKAGATTAVIATLTWVVANPELTQVSINWPQVIWNAVIELAVFLAFVTLLSVLKGDSRKLESTVSSIECHPGLHRGWHCGR